MDDLIWTPILVLFLICSFDGEWRCLNWKVWLFWRLWLDFMSFVFTMVFSFFFYSMGINDFMFLFNIKGLKFMCISNCFYCIISSVLSLVLSMHALRIMISNMLINHLSSSRSSHKMFIVFNKIDCCFF